MRLGLVVAAAAEGHRLDRHRRHAVLGRLDGEIVLIAVVSGAVLALIVDADDVVDAAAVAGDADDGGVRRLAGFRRQEIAEHPGAGAALEDELLAAVAGEVADFEGLRLRAATRFSGKPPTSSVDLGAQPRLPLFGLPARLRLERHAQRRRFVERVGEVHRVEVLAGRPWLRSRRARRCTSCGASACAPRPPGTVRFTEIASCHGNCAALRASVIQSVEQQLVRGVRLVAEIHFRTEQHHLAFADRRLRHGGAAVEILLAPRPAAVEHVRAGEPGDGRGLLHAPRWAPAGRRGCCRRTRPAAPACRRPADWCCRHSPCSSEPGI